MNRALLPGAVAAALALATPPVSAQSELDPMASGVGGWAVSSPVLTIGETIPNTSGNLNTATQGDYTPVGILDGLGAYDKDNTTVRVFVNHELLNFRGNEYSVNGASGPFTLKGARVSYIDIDKITRNIVDAGLAYNTVRRQR